MSILGGRREKAARDTRKNMFNVRRPVVLGFLTLFLLWGGLFGWGAFASISGAVIAAGRVEVEARDQVVEHIDGGTVREILVREGDTVKAGDVLLRFDDKLQRSEESILAATHAELVARRNRLEAEFRGADAILWDAGLARRSRAEPAVRTILEGQKRLYIARRASRAGLEAQLRKRIVQARKQVASLEAQVGAVRRQRSLVTRELKAERQLFKDGLTELHRLLALEREAAGLDGQTGDIEARIAAAHSRTAEIEIQILQIGTKRAEEAEAGAREAQAQENEVREKLLSLRGRLSRMEVRAPLSGEVFGMKVFALGEVVRPGEPILRIVPKDAKLLVRAQLQPIHVDQVRPGQEATLRFSAFQARITPKYEGRIVRVSADAVQDPQRGVTWYDVEVSIGGAIEPEKDLELPAWVAALPGIISRRLPEIPESWHPANWLRRVFPRTEEPAKAAAIPEAKPAATHATGLSLAPGMPVEVHIRIAERSPLSYFVKPLTDYFSRAMKEE